MEKTASRHLSLRHIVGFVLAVCTIAASILLAAGSPVAAEESHAGCSVGVYEPWLQPPSEPWADFALVGWGGTWNCNGAHYCADLYFSSDDFGARRTIRELHWCGTANYSATLGANCYDVYPEMHRYDMLMHADGRTVYSRAVTESLICP